MMYSLCRTAILVIGLIPVTGCGQVAFQRGSGPDAFTSARALCQKQDPGSAAVRACLSAAGWTVQDLNGAEADGPAATPTLAFATTPTSPASAEKIAVGGWWKFGANAADLDAAADACAAPLGTADRPAPGYHLVTRALHACLGAHGWHSVGGPAS